MVDRIRLTEDFGKFPRDDRKKSKTETKRQGGDWRYRTRSGSPRTFISPKELEESMRHPSWATPTSQPEDWTVQFSIPKPAFWQKLVVDFAQWALGDRILIIDRSRIVDTEKYQAELERLWSERGESTIPKPAVIQLQIALDEEEEDGRPATGSTRS